MWCSDGCRAAEGGRALVIQPGAVGDCVLSLPMIRYLKRCGFSGRVDMMGHLGHIAYLAGRSDVDDVLSIDRVSLHPLFTDSETFDLEEHDPLVELFRPYRTIVSFLSDSRGDFERNLVFTAHMTHSAEVLALRMVPADRPIELGGGASAAEPPETAEHVSAWYLEQLDGQQGRTQLGELLQSPLVRLDAADHYRGQSLLRNWGIQGAPLGPDGDATPGGNGIASEARGQGDDCHPVIIMHPGSGGRRKCWPLERFAQLAEQLRAMGAQVVFLAGPTESDREDMAELRNASRDRAVQLAEGLSLDEVAAVLGCCDGFVGNDSGISHLAAAMHVPTLAIFGPTLSRRWGPLGRFVRVCQAEPLAHPPDRSAMTAKNREDCPEPDNQTRWPSVRHVRKAAEELFF